MQACWKGGGKGGGKGAVRPIVLNVKIKKVKQILLYYFELIIC